MEKHKQFKLSRGLKKENDPQIEQLKLVDESFDQDDTVKKRCQTGKEIYDVQQLIEKYRRKQKLNNSRRQMMNQEASEENNGIKLL